MDFTKQCDNHQSHSDFTNSPGNQDTVQRHIDRLTKLLDKARQLLNDIKENRPTLKPETIKLIAKKNIERLEYRNENDRTLLIFLAMRPSVQSHDAIALMQALLESGADINAKCKDGLYHVSDQTENPRTNTALTWAIANGCTKNALWLIEHGPSYGINFNLFAYGHTALQLAIMKGYQHQVLGGSKRFQIQGTPKQFCKIVYELIQASDVNIQDQEFGFTALHMAVIRRDVPVIKWLFAKDADRTLRSKSGHLAIELLEYTEEQANAFIRNKAYAVTLDRKKWDERGKSITDLFAELKMNSEETHQEQKQEVMPCPIHSSPQLQDDIDPPQNDSSYPLSCRVSAPQPNRFLFYTPRIASSVIAVSASPLQ